MAGKTKTYKTFESAFAKLQQDALKAAKEYGKDPNEYIMEGLNYLRGTAEKLGPEAVRQFEDEVVNFLTNGSLADAMAQASSAQMSKMAADKKRADALKDEEKNKPHGYEGWEKTYEEIYGKNIKKDKAFTRDKIIAPIAASAANGVAAVTNDITNTAATKHSILGNAMQAMHNTSMYQDLAGQIRAAREANYNNRRAAREQMKAATINGIGNAIGAGLNTAAAATNQVAYNESAAMDKAQAATIQKNDQPTGDFYRNEMQMRRFGREDNR